MCLPNFIILGAQKAGTSSLYHYLIQHPEISSAVKKEIHFFDFKYNKGLNWYKSNFDNTKKITGEATPNYFFYPNACERIYEHLPGIKLIVLLRNPVERAISHYYHNIKVKREPLDIRHAFNFEKTRLNIDYQKLKADKNYIAYHYMYFSYKAKGIYYKQLQKYFKYFNKNQFFIIQSERFFNNPELILLNLWKYLGVNENFIPNDLEPVNKSKIKKDVPEKFYKELIEFYKPYNEKLYNLLGYEYDW